MQVEIVDYQASDAKETLARSLHNTGFAVLANHPIAPERIDELYAEWGRFFAGDTKMGFERDLETQDGYFPFRSENAKDSDKKDLKEFYHYYPWGRVPEALQAVTSAMYNDLNQLGLDMLSWLDGEAPEAIRGALSRPLSQMAKDSEQTLLRILHYPPVEEDVEEGAIRAAAHEDINLITLLLAGSQPGLQAQDKSGTWHDVPCDRGMITINNGDMLALATQDYFPSTTHRVVNPDSNSNQSRYSMPMFIAPQPGVMLSETLSAGDYLQIRLREIGLK